MCTAAQPNGSYVHCGTVQQQAVKALRCSMDTGGAYPAAQYKQLKIGWSHRRSKDLDRDVHEEEDIMLSTPLIDHSLSQIIGGSNGGKCGRFEPQLC